MEVTEADKPYIKFNNDVYKVGDPTNLECGCGCSVGCTGPCENTSNYIIENNLDKVSDDKIYGVVADVVSSESTGPVISCAEPKDIQEISKARQIEILQNAINKLRMFGLGDIYGCLGRMHAILRHQLLNDDPNCYHCDKDGKRAPCTFSEEDQIVLREAASYVDEMLEDDKKKMYDDLCELRNYLETKQ